MKHMFVSRVTTSVGTSAVGVCSVPYTSTYLWKTIDLNIIAIQRPCWMCAVPPARRPAPPAAVVARVKYTSGRQARVLAPRCIGWEARGEPPPGVSRLAAPPGDTAPRDVALEALGLESRVIARVRDAPDQLGPVAGRSPR